MTTANRVPAVGIANSVPTDSVANSVPTVSPAPAENNPLRAASRGQAEPLAALIAVTLVCTVLSLYVGTLSNAVAESESERRVAESTLDGIWRDASDDGIFEADTDLATAVSPSSVPDGYTVSVEITVVAPNGSERTAGRAQFGEGSAGPPPEDAQRASRAVSVQRTPGDVRPGRLVVEVWD
jgi:hypothetical protein